MSTLFLCRAKERSPIVGAVLKPVSSIPLNSAYYDALDCWGCRAAEYWLALEQLNGLTLDDCIHESIEDEAAREMFCGVLLRLVSQCDEAALWYAGFFEDIPRVANPADFVSVVRAALTAGELEPSVRLVI